ncbi:RagB/SusD family nutrient uptake outer membrane protein [Sphingobacterium sp. SGG-5]|uniref:RagB/SusD family nutrient uptake outer membrane protein n=1 Tax=Sphingobacterium sp. SGG-5 TaxID=2710881 RepID=UPI0013EC7884|nr:RagB/SusD family nutrient uptake outer membrane protein [Sphingobacterium sp. SGG-5]NGM62163.1 RagB/SusD family nutrient uptake outer membrane protein [Sphingobacterium sp. SGG-5]
MRYINTIIKTLLIFSMSLASCDGLLDIDSQHIVNEENKWKDINDARASLMGIYGLVRTALAENNAHWIYGDLRQGDFIAPNKRELQEVIDGNLLSSNNLMKNLSNWRKFYAAINAANLFIKYSGQIMELDPQYTEVNHNIDVAQARALKGFCYFLMARIWGEVPIWDKAYEGNFPKIDASSEDAVLTYAENELKSALNVLPYRYGFLNDEIYPVDMYHGYSYENWDGVLFNRLSVNAILAHLCAWSGKYLEASVYADFVLTNAAKSVAVYAPSVTLTTPEGYFFNSNNSHLVAFPFKWSAMEASFDGHIEQLTLASPLVNKPSPDMYIPIERIISIFHEDGDVRFHVNEKGEYVSNYFSELGGVVPIFSKIKVIRGGTSDGSFPLFSSVMVLSRMEEIALLRAEALAVLGDNEGIARGILNQIRRSRGLGDAPVSNDLIDEIFAERRRELMGEGWRWFDLVRYNKIKRNDPDFMQLIQDKGIFWPIAEEVLSNNDLLEQNPYWE